MFAYAANGDLSSYTDGTGALVTYGYDAYGYRSSESDDLGPRLSASFDALGRKLSERNGEGDEIVYTYDALDRVRSLTHAAGTRYVDYQGRVRTERDELGNATVFEHDAHGNRSAQRNAAGIVTRFAYDARHRVIAIDHPIGGDEGFAYNGEGELTAHTDRAGQRIEIERDGLGRITARRYTAAASGDVNREVFTLDGDGQPTTLSQYGDADGPHHVQRRYDGQGRLIEEDDRFNQRSAWTYDEAGNRLSVTDPAGTTTTAPDRLNRIARQTTAAGSTELSYSTAGRLQQITHPNGARSETRYDNAGRIERITHYQGNSEVARFEYDYDDRGNRSEERRIDASGTQHTTYDYDQDDRLTGTTVTAPGGSVTETTYTLDEVGNREREVVRRGSATVSDIAYTYQAHQRLIETRDRISGVITEYSYDARGHLISETRSGQTTTYRPNAQDRLATLTLPGAPPVDYAYDSEGKRVERRTPTELTRFGWDGETLRRETNAANNVIEAHDWAAGRILSSRRLNDTRYAQHDALRSPIRWSQSTGTEQGQLRYDAWGETTDTHPDLPRIAYTGHYREREGIAYYAQQRYYRPGLGRFNRIDPWSGDEANPITLNKYLYANGNPLVFVDPDGRQSCGPLCQAGFMHGYAQSDDERVRAVRHGLNSSPVIGVPVGAAQRATEIVQAPIDMVGDAASAVVGDAGAQARTGARWNSAVAAHNERAPWMVAGQVGLLAHEANRLTRSVIDNARRLSDAVSHKDYVSAGKSGVDLGLDFTEVAGPAAAIRSGMLVGITPRRVVRTEQSVTVVESAGLNPVAGSSGRAGGSTSTQPWEMINAERQDVLVQSGENTCGPACASNMARRMGYSEVTEASLIQRTGSGVTDPGSLARALESSTGREYVGGSMPFDPADLASSQVRDLVGGLTRNGERPFMALFHRQNAGMRDGHWVLVEGIDSAGNIEILDPAGYRYWQTPTGFQKAWRFGDLVQ